MSQNAERMISGRVREGLIAGGLVSLAMASQAWATSSNIDHQISVFNIETYASAPDTLTGTSIAWKEAIPVSSSMDAYNTFYNAMTGCSSDACAHASSFRRHNADVTVDNMVSQVSGSGSLSGADLIFFYGHNISMQEWNHDSLSFGAWVPSNNNGFTNQPVNGSWMMGQIECPSCQTKLAQWGTSVIPYYYHQRGTNIGQTGILDATVNKGYGVFYAYNALTSVLIGQDYKTGTWVTENTNSFSNANTPSASHTGQLGTGDTDFIIANGCEAVPVAEYINHVPVAGGVGWSQHAVRQWKPSWRGLHLVVGHYQLTTTNCLPNVTTIANDLKAGDGVIRSYFEAHSCSDTSEPALYMPGALAPRANVYDTDKWAAPEMAKPTTTDEAGTWSAWAWAAQ